MVAVNERPDYGNWVSRKFIYGPGIIGLIFLGLAIVFLPLIAIAVLCFLLSAYFIYARYLFAPGGKNVQEQVRNLVLDHLEWDGEGKALDIGCGNGALTIGLARKCPAARVTGIDYWGKNWDYSRSTCDANARLEGVGDRVTFQKASATALPFADGTFDAAVSNLVFHEVRDARDKRELVREALRVVKKGGRFSFQDLFLVESYYGSPDELVRTIQGWGVRKVELIDTHDAAFIPGALKLPFMVGKIAVLAGEK